MNLKFEIIHTSKKSHARVGKIYTSHGIIDTPAFVPVATNASLKAIPIEHMPEIDLMFCNTYHLLLQPGTETIKNLGGLHSFMNRQRPIITDSGGFQVFSLAYGSVHEELKSAGKKKTKSNVIKISEDGVVFRSYRNGEKILLSPESSVKAQKDLGADIIIPFDELLPYHIQANQLQESLDRTHRWEIRSLTEHKSNENGQFMYGVIHGGPNLDLRKYSCKFLSEHAFDGFAIGGSVGKTKEELYNIVNFTKRELPVEFPVHLLGIGDPSSILNLIETGVDSFDSSYPTKAARHGTLFSSTGPIKIEKTIYKNDPAPIDNDCECPICKNHSRAYIHHLFKAFEITGPAFASTHNIHYMSKLMKDIRNKILRDEI